MGRWKSNWCWKCYSKQESEHATLVDILLSFLDIILFPILLYFCCKTTYKYIDKLGEVSLGVCTAVSFIVPFLILWGVSIRMYIMQQETVHPRNVRYTPMNFLPPPFTRSFQALKFALQSYRSTDEAEQKASYRLLLKENSDRALLKVVQNFLESAPQQVLRIIYLLKILYQDTEKELNWEQPVFAVLSFFAMTYSLFAYQRSIRLVQDDKAKIPLFGSACYCLMSWNMLILVSRVLLLSTLIFLEWKWTLVAISIHVLLMALGVYLLEPHKFCTSINVLAEYRSENLSEKVANFLFSSLLGLVYVFIYLTPGHGPTRYRYVCFYTFCLIENFIGAALWHTMMSPSWLTQTITVLLIAPFLFGILFMILYHKYFHPRLQKEDQDQEITQ